MQSVSTGLESVQSILLFSCCSTRQSLIPLTSDQNQKIKTVSDLDMDQAEQYEIKFEEREKRLIYYYATTNKE
jgi:hypothetical protein